MKVSAKRANKKIKILFIYRSWSSFVNNDYEILKKHFDVEPLQWRGKRDIIKMIIGVIKSDLVFSWFASDHAGIAGILATIFRKKSIVVVGGGDAANVPEIGYGLWAVGSKKNKILAKIALDRANAILVVDLSLKNNLVKNAKIGEPSKIICVPTGYDSNFWKPNGKKEDIVLSVAGAKNIMRVKLKGLDTFVRAAKYLPDAKFLVIGVEGEARRYLEEITPENVELIGYVKNEKLLTYYQKAKVYCQLSRYEGLPNALCEAMLCECIPVGTKYCGIPRAIGDTGFYVKYGDVEDTVEGIKKALESDAQLGKKARKRIIYLFPKEKRENRLVKIIKEITKTQISKV